MSRIVRPVRAWAEYDEWSVYLEEAAGYWDNVLIPKSKGDWLFERELYDGVVDFIRSVQPPFAGPLRSLRVLYENGYELELFDEYEVDPLKGQVIYDWYWAVLDGTTCRANGHFEEDKDSEAVERALIAAAAWFTQQQGGDL